ncbi:ATP-dependent helicase HrpB [Rhizobium sp. SSA_523]|uniref:ATP-dependent helicase HrpB n=1 Tax=Rhizobium sp. SSA_523 TaxID=2952477 RepID=UPI0020905C46|nr:ATP-dependent helicase HrpB [Rhizobium sp. SSA_523]MCO5734671.1 ATP-dependent helicase HrpB [Rhizobium sp. SSA_523]WKC23439.1 ATP-dependent helicase HrpB [Rhizobium sp. SSA_523]
MAPLSPTRLPEGLPSLPITPVLPQIAAALADGNRAVLSAPPGAGKTTLVPLSLLSQSWCTGKIILAEPRRLAARAAAHRMAALLGEEVGATVGYRMRLDSRISSATRIEVVTEGVFTRMILDDPELAGVSAVLFDEFHERSMDADFGLALALDTQGALREDLRLLVMSATLDVERVSALLGQAPVIISEGRSHPIDIIYAERDPAERVEDAVTRAVVKAISEEEGSVLAFLPGQAEILRTRNRLAGLLPEAVDIAPLFGGLSQGEQDAAIRPSPAGRRKVVLATSIAETSITIDGVRIVIDSGLQRLPVFEPATGITRLETQRVSRASADQRAGRAGRTEPGKAIRLWHGGQTSALPAFSPPQILASDLASFALDLAHWGVRDPGDLAFLDPPPRPALAEARSLLRMMDALDDQDRLTARGRKIRGMALPPRLAAMALEGAARGQALEACRLAVLMTEQGLGGQDVDLDQRLRAFRQERGQRAEQARRLAARLASTLSPSPASGSQSEALLVSDLLMHAYPDRVAIQRGARGRFVMANGRGAELPETERLAGAAMLVIADLSGQAARGRILAAGETTRERVEAELGDKIVRGAESFFDRATRQVRSRRVVRLGGLVLEETPLPRPGGREAAQALSDGVRQLGLSALPFHKEAAQLRERLAFLHHTVGDPWPDVSDEALLARLAEWFEPFQEGRTGLDAIDGHSLAEGLRALVPHSLSRELNRLAPTHFDAPTGNRHPIRYDREGPVLTIRVQELFGLKAHPCVAGGKLPLLLELTSPAHRPLQTTRDLPGFWAGSWKDVRAEMRGRYPRHPWPDDPANAAPTHRAKPRGT